MPFKLSIKNFPKGATIAQIKKFFDGVKISFVKVNNSGNGVLEVRNELSIDAALNKDNAVFKNNHISVRLMKENESFDNKKKQFKNDKKKFPTIDEKKLIEQIEDTGRLYIRNLSFEVTEADVVELFKEFGDLAEVHVPYDFNLKRGKGFGFVTYLSPKDAVEAFKALDKTEFKGHKIHIIPGAEKPDGQKCKGVLETPQPHQDGTSSFKDARQEELKATASSAHNWNALFVNSDVVAQYLADKLQITKNELFGDALKGSISVKLAQAETQLVRLIQDWLAENHIRLDVLDKITNRGPKEKGQVNVAFALSSTTFIVKNLSVGVTKEDLEGVFSQYKGLKEILLPPHGVTAIVSYELSQQAKVAYLNCAYMAFQDSVMMLQWAPVDLMAQSKPEIVTQYSEIKAVEAVSEESLTKKEVKKRRREAEKIEEENEAKKLKLEQEQIVEQKAAAVVSAADLGDRTAKILIKNISFQCTLQELEELFRPYPGVTAIRLPKKTNGGHKGYAFVEFETEDQAQVLMDSMSASTHFLGRRLILLYSH